VHGVSKSDKILFQIAIDELGCKPSEIAFIDDSDKNLRIAKKYGMIPIKACGYNGKKENKNFLQIKMLNELATLFLNK
jgi:FMN phosphatase YigB (HAD superfamily)